MGLKRFHTYTVELAAENRQTVTFTVADDEIRDDDQLTRLALAHTEDDKWKLTNVKRHSLRRHEEEPF